MPRFVIFMIFQIVVSAIAIARGGQPERLVGAFLALALAATALLQSHVRQRFFGLEVSTLIVDFVLLLLLLGVALRANRFWPLWITALQAVAIWCHLVKASDFAVAPWAYGFFLSVWGYPMSAVLLVGTLRHVNRVNHGGPEANWSSSLMGRMYHEPEAKIIEDVRAAGSPAASPRRN